MYKIPEKKMKKHYKKHYNLSISLISNFFLPNVVLHKKIEGYFRFAERSDGCQNMRRNYLLKIHISNILDISKTIR